MANFDLHLHSYWSYDALANPEEYFAQAQKLNLKAFAITDHHNADSFTEIRPLVKKYPGAHLILGAEMSAMTPAGVQDIVCLGLPEKPQGNWKRVLDKYHELQVSWGKKISEGFTRLGYHLDLEVMERILRSYRPAHVIDVQGITHIRSTDIISCLMSQGLKSRNEYVAVAEPIINDFMDSKDVINAVHEARGIAFWAHPYLYNKRKDEKWLDMLFEYAPADGIECGHSEIPLEMTEFYRNYCVAHKLLSSSGSDTHWNPKGAPAQGEVMAAQYGDDRWLEEILERVTLWS